MNPNLIEKDKFLEGLKDSGLEPMEIRKNNKVTAYLVKFIGGYIYAMVYKNNYLALIKQNCILPTRNVR